MCRSFYFIPACTPRRPLISPPRWHSQTHSDYTIGPLLWMPQVSLFPGGCAIYRYSWETKISVSYITSPDALFYLSTIVISTPHRGRPHRTPSMQMLHCIVQIPGLLHSISTVSVKRSDRQHPTSTHVHHTSALSHSPWIFVYGDSHWWNAVSLLTAPLPHRTACSDFI